MDFVLPSGDTVARLILCPSQILVLPVTVGCHSATVAIVIAASISVAARGLLQRESPLRCDPRHFT